MRLLIVLLQDMLLAAPAAAAPGDTITAAFFRPSSTSCDEQGTGLELLKYYQTGPGCSRPVLQSELPSMGQGDSATVRWIVCRAGRFLEVERLHFAMKGKVTKRTVEKEYRNYEDRIANYEKCKTVYLVLLYNYCLVQDVCRGNIVSTALPEKHGDKKYKEAQVRSYLSKTLDFLLMGHYRAKDKAQVIDEDTKLAVRGDFYAKYNLENPDAYDDGTTEGRARHCTASSHARRRHSRRCDHRPAEGVFRKLSACYCCFASADEGKDSSSSSAPLVSPDHNKQARKTSCDQPLERPLERNYLFDLLYPFTKKLPDLKLKYLLHSEREIRNPYTLAFLCTLYRDFLDELFSKLEAWAVRLKTEIEPQ